MRNDRKNVYFVRSLVVLLQVVDICFETSLVRCPRGSIQFSFKQIRTSFIQHMIEMITNFNGFWWIYAWIFLQNPMWWRLSELNCKLYSNICENQSKFSSNRNDDRRRYLDECWFPLGYLNESVFRTQLSVRVCYTWIHIYKRITYTRHYSQHLRKCMWWNFA